MDGTALTKETVPIGAVAAAGWTSPQDPRPQDPRPRAWHRRLVVATLLIAPLLGGLVYLLVAFQPFADAAGGCGGG